MKWTTEWSGVNGLYWIITKAEEIRTVVAVMEDGTVYRLGDAMPVPFDRIAWWASCPLDVPASPDKEADRLDDQQPDCVDCIAPTCVGCRFYAGRPEDETERAR